MMRKSTFAFAGAAMVAAWTTLPAQAAPVADTVADWNAASNDGIGITGGAVTPGTAADVPQQGGQNWQYGYYATDGAPGTFTLLGEFNGAAVSGGTNTGAWDPTGSGVSPVVGRDSVHPGYEGSLNNRWAVKRWTSEVTDTVTISGSVRRGQAANGDGITLRFYVNGVDQTANNVTIEGSDTSVKNFSFSVPVAAGQFIDFAADRRGNPSFDSTVFNAQIVPEPATLGLIGLGALRLLGRRRRA